MARLRPLENESMKQFGSSYGLRKRKKSTREALPLEILLKRIKTCKSLVIFTGSGLSAASGMSTFTSKGGLYERAQKRYKLSEGKKLFCYPFFERQKKDAQAFYAEIYKEARVATPGRGHDAIRSIEESGKLVRHYTLNVDGLAGLAGCSTWHADMMPEGKTVEMHGSITQMVCTNEDCKSIVDMDEGIMNSLTAKEDVPCPKCSDPSVRCRIMLYDDKDGEFITPDDIFEVMEEDVSKADVILWVGISFEQSASTHYFRKAREFLLRAKHWKGCTQAIINLSEEAHFNLLSACNNIDEVELLDIRGSSDDVLAMIAKEMAVDVVTAKRSRKSDTTDSSLSLSPPESKPDHQPAAIPVGRPSDTAPAYENDPISSNLTGPQVHPPEVWLPDHKQIQPEDQAAPKDLAGLEETPAQPLYTSIMIESASRPENTVSSPMDAEQSLTAKL